MESDRIVAVALESPVHWLHVEQPPDAVPSFLPVGGTCLLSFSERTSGRARRWHWVLPSGSPLDEWTDSGRWGTGASLHVQRSLALVTLVGDGAYLGAKTLFEAESALLDAAIPTHLSQTGAHALSLLVAESDGEAASRVLHRTFLEDASKG